MDGEAKALAENEDVKEFYLGVSAAGRKSFPEHEVLPAAQALALLSGAGRTLYRAVVAAVERTGLRIRGGFHPEAADAVPRLRTGEEAATLILVGNVGSSLWEGFAGSGHAGRSEHPLDEWSREVVSALARECGAEPLFPFGGPPFLPFIRWAERADTVWPSVMGPLIHPPFRPVACVSGALSFARRVDLPPREPAGARPCDECPDRPCLIPCPVGAVRDGAFDAAGCAAWLGGSAAVRVPRSGVPRPACVPGRPRVRLPARARRVPHGGFRASERSTRGPPLMGRVDGPVRHLRQRRAAGFPVER